MLDPQLLRKNLDDVVAGLRKKGVALDVAHYQKLESQRKDLQVKTQALQNQKNSASKAIGQAKAQGQDISAILTEVSAFGEQLKANELALSSLQGELKAFLSQLPNLLHESVPEGATEDDNALVSTWGEPTAFAFDAKDHVDLGEALGWFDVESATKISGSRFSILKGPLAKLHRALAQFMLNLHTEEHGYLEVIPPLLVNPEAMYGTGQLPKFGDDAFSTTGDHPHYLIPTSEVPLTNMAADTIYSAEELPVKLAAHTSCFRKEAGSAGRDTRGMIRQHQFEKVELVQIVKPGQSLDALEELTGHAEKVLQQLQLPYRKVCLCSGDTGFTATKTYDLEVWLPGQNQYREISSCSAVGDFQARRMGARWRNPERGDKPELVHTLNGSGVAVGRALVAVMENYQKEDGSIRIPDVLKKFFNDAEILR